MTKKLAVSIVVPTLGDIKLLKLIKHLNKDKNYKISEIILSIPRNKFNYIKDLTRNWDNIKIVYSNINGQVLQRIKGFKLAKEKNVLQLDDDVLIDANSVNILMRNMYGINCQKAISPVYKDFDKKYLNEKSKKFLSKIRLFIMCLLFGSIKKINSIGNISNALINYGFGRQINGIKNIEVEWLLGACVIHKKKNLILENFYPYQGKSYCEDLLHSIELRKKNIKLFITNSAYVYCKTENNINNYNELLKYIKALNLFVKRSNQSLFDSIKKIQFFFIYQIIKLLIKKII
jgi:hypothetical protein